MKGDPAFACLLQCGDDVTFLEYRVSRGTIALHKAEGRLQVGRRKSCRRGGNRTGGKKFLRDQNHAAVQLTEVRGIEQPRLELALETGVRQNPLAIDLVFERRLLERP